MTCRPEQSLLADSSKRSRVDHSGVPDHSAPVDLVPSLHPALVLQPSLNGRSPSSTSVPVSDSAGATLRPVSDHESHRQAEQHPDRPSSRHADPQPDVNDVATTNQRTHPSEHLSQPGRPKDSHRSHRSDSRHSRDSRHRSSSQRPDESLHRRSSSHRPPDSSRQVSHRERDAPRHEPRPVSRSHRTSSDRQVSYSDRQAQPSRPDKSESRGSHEARQRPDSRAGGHSRDVPQGHRNYGRDRPRGNRTRDDKPRDYRNGNQARQDYGRDAGRQDRHKESDSHRDKRKREEKEDKVTHSSTRWMCAPLTAMYCTLSSKEALAGLSVLVSCKQSLYKHCS